jgi:hypothetical protein
MRTALRPNILVFKGRALPAPIGETVKFRFELCAVPFQHHRLRFERFIE